ncbi:histidinol-phosphate aminotransferase [Elusimicrobium posterum]|uniref:histidinol-phosphate transaminase n=1 Tax=Elusimicrobium posterum TaxID=3116653 RepID=UPI003C78D211
MKNTLKLVRPELRNLKPYAAECFEPGKIYLNANENPFPLSCAPKSNRYPEIRPQKLLAALAIYYKVKPENLVLTAGSDQAIDTIIRTFCTAGKDNILITKPSFSMYSVYAKVQNAAVNYVPLTDGKLDVKEVLKALKTFKPKVFFLPNPGAPQGVLFKQADILKIISAAKGKTMVVIDEAYLEFAKSPSYTKYLSKYPNLIVLRTLSKAFALAGARIGVAIANKEISSVFNAVLPPYPLSCTTISSAFALFSRPNNIKTAKSKIESIIKERKTLEPKLKKLKFIKKVYPSKTNFFFIETENDKKVFEILTKNNIIVRYFPQEGLRITVSSKTENAKLLKVLALINVNK